MRSLVLSVAFIVVMVRPVVGQSVLERSPNLHGVWGLESGHVVFVLAHRFEFIERGKEVFSVPTLTLGAGLPLGLAVGLDLTTISEAIPERFLGNEFQWWVKRPFELAPSTQIAVMGAYNTAASSLDGALSVRQSIDRFQVFAEGRAFSNLFGMDTGALAGAVGAAVHLTDYLALTGDVGRVLTEDTIPTAWSAALAIAIPASPHTFSLQVANSGATTLQGASRKKTVGGSSARYGFAFTIPFGSRSRWTRIFTGPPTPPAPAGQAGVHVRPIAGMAFPGGDVRIRAGETVEWVNQDPIVHTVTAVDRSWDSGSLAEGERYRRTFETAGRYEFYCTPHPAMRGTVVVEP